MHFGRKRVDVLISKRNSDQILGENLCPQWHLIIVTGDLVSVLHRVIHLTLTQITPAEK